MSKLLAQLSLLVLKLEYHRRSPGQYQGCLWLGSLDHQVTPCHGIDFVWWTGPCLPWAKISTTCAISTLRMDNKYEYIFMVPLLFAHVFGLQHWPQQHTDPKCIPMSHISRYCMVHRLTFHTDGLVHERCNSSALAMELCLSCTYPSILSEWYRPYSITKLIHNISVISYGIIKRIMRSFSNMLKDQWLSWIR